MRISEIYTICSSANSYIEVYQRISSTTKDAYPVANYVWTALMNKNPDEIPRFYDKSKSIEVSVKQWIQRNTQA